jgi:UDP-3-O-[3-hydroxymyristoyl] glucosamine N-acyltransferase
MLISNISAKTIINSQFKLINETEFDFFALTADKVDFKKCIFIHDKKYIQEIDENTFMIITTNSLVEEIKNYKGGYCITENPKYFFYQLHDLVYKLNFYPSNNFNSRISETAIISNLAAISKKNVVIGENCIIEEFVVIRENTFIGDNSIIRAGSIIGGQGFDFIRNLDNVNAISHQGSVKIGDNVEIQQNCCIDKAVFPWDSTIIDDYTKTDNLVHIAHSAKIGKRVLITSSSNIAGRTIVGDDSWLGVGAILSNGIELGKKTRANIGSVVVRSIPEGESQTGYFSIEHSKFIQNFKKSIGKD